MREDMMRELARRADVAIARTAFMAPDGDDEPTLWLPRSDGGDPICLFRRCDVGWAGWALVAVMLRAVRQPPPVPRVIPSRSSDPATSKAAEPAPLKAGTQRHRLLAAFGQPAAADGLTDEEAADLADGVPYRSEFAKRCSELRAAELLEVVDGVTRPGVAGHQRIVSRITDRGRDALRLLTPTGLPKPDDGA